MLNQRKSLLQMFEEAANKPVPYEGLVFDPADAGLPPKAESRPSVSKAYDTRAKETDIESLMNGR